MKIRRILCLLLCLSFAFQQLGFAQVVGQLDVAGYLTSLRSNIQQDTFRPLHLRYLSYNTATNQFNLLVDKGNLKDIKQADLEANTQPVFNYFLIGVTLPNDTFWVNLRPDAETNIIDDELATTDIGRIMLEADVQLKKDTARYTSPDTTEGKLYWDKLYQKAGEIFGYENVEIPTLTRPWIVPDEILVTETADGAYIFKATLKVLLEQDYLKGSAVYNFTDERLKSLNEYSSRLIRELIIPKITQEVNSAKRYAGLRQVYHSLIFAQWFKGKFNGKDGRYASLIDRHNLQDLTSKEAWSKTTYFKQYQKSFKDGEYNTQQSVYTPYGQTIRSYFSGGIELALSLPVNNAFPGDIVPNNPNAVPLKYDGNTRKIGPREGITQSVASSATTGVISEEERGYYSIVIDWVEYILRNYETRFGGNKLIFIGGASKRAWEAAVFLSAHYGIEQRNIIYLDFPREVMRRVPPGTIERFLEQEGVFEGGNQIAIFDNWSDTGGTLDRVASILRTHKPGIKVVAYLMYGSDNAIDNYAHDVPVTNSQVNLAAIFIGKSNWMRTDARRQSLIAYKEEKGEVKPLYLSLADLRLFLAEMKPDTDVHQIKPETLTHSSQQILPLVQAWLELRGFSRQVTHSEEAVRRANQELVSFCDANSSNVADSQDATFAELLQERRNKKSSGPVTGAPDRGDNPASSPLAEGAKMPGGIDFRTLPIVTTAMNNLKAVNGKIPNLNLNSEWQEIERLVQSGITPSGERMKEYLQVSCYQGKVTQDRERVISCISDILRQQEERYVATEPLLIDILIVLETNRFLGDFKAIFINDKQ